jgi:hypothetical protein
MLAAGYNLIMPDHTNVSQQTKDAEHVEALHDHTAGPAPTESEELAAQANDDIGVGVSEHEREMARRGAAQKGEGRIAP